MLKLHRCSYTFLHTDLDAPRGRLAVADPDRPGVTQWRTLLAEDPESVLEDVALTDGGGDATEPELLLASRRRHAVSEVTVHDLATGSPLREFALPGLGSVTELSARRGASGTSSRSRPSRR